MHAGSGRSHRQSKSHGVPEGALRMVTTHCREDATWLEVALDGLRVDGVAVVEGVLDDELLGQTRETMYKAQQAVVAEVGQERLAQAGELGVVRLMARYEPSLLRLVELPEVLEVVDAALSPTAILHLQNGLILPPTDGAPGDIFQLKLHRDFPRILNGYMMSLNTFLAVDEFTIENGGTTFVPGTHQRASMPSDNYVRRSAVQAQCAAGSMIVFDSTVLHAAGQNHSTRDRLAVNQQFTRSYVKQQVDYVRALGDELVQAQQPRTQQLLGWYTRVVTSLEEFYRPPDERLYRSGQG